MWDSIWINANLATMTAQTGYGEVCGGALGVAGGKIVWAGAMAALEAAPEKLARTVHDAGGRWITPGLIDCHTHLVYGGSRAQEFALRLHGARYEDIAKAGGGIVSTVRATREASEEALYQAALTRLENLMAEGVTGVEIKSGYGLDLATEQKQLRVATRLRDQTGLRVQRTFLGAHALPPEYKDRADEYIDLVCDTMIPALHREGLIDAVDAFCENIGFSRAQTTRVFEAARQHGLPVKLHAEQLSNQHGAALAAGYAALSADHLEYLDEEAVAAMAAAGTVAVLLPGAFYFLRETKKPPVDLLRRYGVPMAVATDHNPGTSPVHSLLLMLSMGCTFFHLTPEESLAGVTRHAAAALGWDGCGMLRAGMAADFVLWDIAEPAELCYRFGFNPCAGVVRAGLYASLPQSSAA